MSKKISKVVLTCFFLLMLTLPVWAADTFVRVSINGTNVNLRPLPQASGGIVAQVNSEYIFIAEKWPIRNLKDDTQWYRLVLAVNESGEIVDLEKHDKRFKAEAYPFLIERYASVTPLEPGDAEKIAGTAYGRPSADSLGKHLPEMVARFGEGEISREFNTERLVNLEVFDAFIDTLVMPDTHITIIVDTNPPSAINFMYLNLQRKGTRHDGFVIGEPDFGKDQVRERMREIHKEDYEEPKITKKQDGGERWHFGAGEHNSRYFHFDANGVIQEHHVVAVPVSDAERSLGDYFITYGFADEPGSRLLVRDIEADTAKYTLAIGPYGKSVRIAYAGLQDENSEQNSNRDTMWNFDNMPGYVYNAINGRMVPNETYALAAGQFDKVLVELIPPDGEIRETTMGNIAEARIEKLKGRKIQWSNLLGTTKDDGQVGLVLFKRSGDDMLFSIVYLTDEKTLFWDNPAQYNENSTWRVDMEDEPGSFVPLFLARLDNSLVLILTWGAPEGENIVVLYENNGKFIQSMSNRYYRYCAPF